MTATDKNVQSYNRRTFDRVRSKRDNKCRVPVSAHFVFDENKQTVRDFEYEEVSLALIVDQLTQKFGVDLEMFESIAAEKGEQTQ